MFSYNELTTVNRGDPCKEYPGSWTIYCGAESMSFGTLEAALVYGKKKNEVYSKVYVSWCCSENDPRIGQVWFTGFYQHGFFDSFGRYRQ